MSSLLLLYQSILVAILSEWISDEDLCYLDCSVTQQKLRQLFLYILPKCSSVHKSLKLDSQDKYEWIQLRGIKLKSLYLSPEVNIDCGLLKYLLSSVQQVLLIEVTRDVRLPVIVDGLGLSVDRLVFIESRESEILEVLLKLTHVNQLDISGCSMVSNGFDAKFHSLFPHANLISHCCIGWISLMKQFPPIVPSVPWTIGRLHGNNAMTVEQCDALLPFSEQVTSLFLQTKNDLSKHVAMHFVNLISFEALRIGLLDIDFINIFTACKHLRHISVGLGMDWDLDVYEAMVEHCPCLETFKIKGGLTYAYGLQRLFDGCLYLSCLSYSTNVSFPGLLLHITRNVESIVLHNPVGYSLGDTKIRKSNIRDEMKIENTSYCCVANADLKQLFIQNPSLHRVEIVNYKLTDDVLAVMTAHCLGLTSVSLLGCKVSSHTLFIFSKCSNLTAFSIEGVSNITDDMVKMFVVDKPSFAKLALINCSGFTGDVLITISTHCNRIKHVEITNVGTINNQQVIALLQKCPLLYYLDLTGCFGVNKTIAPFLEGRRGKYLIQGLTSYGYKKIS